MKQVLFDSKAVNISYETEDKYLYIEWKGYAKNDEYLDVLSKQVSFTKQYQAAKIVYDLRKMAVVSADNQKYTNEVYFPEVARAGSKYAGIIVPENVFGQASVQNILGKKNEALFKAELFGEPSKAIAWLKEIA